MMEKRSKFSHQAILKAWKASILGVQKRTLMEICGLERITGLLNTILREKTLRHTLIKTESRFRLKILPLEKVEQFGLQVQKQESIVLAQNQSPSGPTSL